MQPAISIVDLPHEILLAIIGRIRYHPRNLSALNLTSHFFHDLLVSHKSSLVKEFARSQFRLEWLIHKPSSPSPIWLRHRVEDRHINGKLATICLEEPEVAARAIKILGTPASSFFVMIGLNLAEGKMSGWNIVETADFVDTMPLTLVYIVRLTAAMLTDVIISRFVLHSQTLVLNNHLFEMQIFTEMLLCGTGWVKFWCLLGLSRTAQDSVEQEIARVCPGQTARAADVVDTLDWFIEIVARIGPAHGADEELKSQIQRRVERELGERSTRELDFAVIDRLKKDGLSNNAVLELVAHLEEWKTTRIQC